MQKEKKLRTPMTPERIFTITMILTFAVGIFFMVRNFMGGAAQAAIIIGVCLVVFALVVFLLNKLRAPKSAQMMAVSVLLVILVLFISLNSGSYYSDDFPLYLALLALTGLYLEPRCTLVQAVAIDVALVIMYVMHPEKAESLSQYIMCVLLANVAAALNFMVIRRGRAFINIANARSKEADILLDSVKNAGDELQANYENSSRRIAGMRDTQNRLESSTRNLLHNSNAINRESDDVSAACNEAYGCVQTTEQSIMAVNEAVGTIEGALADSRAPMEAMNTNLNSVKDIIHDTAEVFEALRQQMVSISALTEQLGNIAFNTKMLALNASIEAARAGQYGAGFSVVANEVQSLAADSDACSNQVTEVVEAMKKQVEISAKQIAESVKGIDTSVTTLGELDASIAGLMDPFQSLHSNLELQNENVNNLNALFSDLNTKVSSMSVCSNDNREAVSSIMDALTTHKQHVDLIISDSVQINELSSSMLAVTKK